MRIAIVVPGRFHAFDLARALAERHDVVVFTNYPAWAARRFGLSDAQVRSFWLHGVIARIAERVSAALHLPYPEPVLHPIFGRWAARQLRRQEWDVVHPFSGVALESLKALQGRNCLRILMRGSSHIRTQARILEEESARTGARLEHPSTWMLGRELAEYAAADRILVLSTFSKQSFVEEGVPSDRLCLVPLGASVEMFRPTAQVWEERRRRILSGEPLRILNVGTQCFRKGFWDAAEIVRSLPPDRFRFRFVGPALPEVSALVATLRDRAEFIPKQPQHTLPEQYAGADVFLFPTIEDGFPQVLAQAAMSGLPILTTPNGAGSDLVAHGITGFILPARDPQAFVERLFWFDRHRTELAAMMQNVCAEFRPRDWSQVAIDFEKIVSGVAHSVCL